MLYSPTFTSPNATFFLSLLPDSYICLLALQAPLPPIVFPSFFFGTRNHCHVQPWQNVATCYIKVIAGCVEQHFAFFITTSYRHVCADWVSPVIRPINKRHTHQTRVNISQSLLHTVSHRSEETRCSTRKPNMPSSHGKYEKTIPIAILRNSDL